MARIVVQQSRKAGEGETSVVVSTVAIRKEADHRTRRNKQKVAAVAEIAAVRVVAKPYEKSSSG